MSNQCSYLFNQQSFSLFTQFNTPLKPYLTTFHNNFILFGSRTRSRTLCLSPRLAAHSSSDIVLIATTQHRDGSLVFRFGDAREVVKNDDVVEQVETLTEQEGDVVKVLDGDQERQVIIKTIEVNDGIRNEDIDSDVAENKTNVISDLRDDRVESSEKLSDISAEEAISLQADAKMSKYLKILESTLDEIECTSQLEGDESSNPTISLLDGGPNKDKNENSEEMLLKDSDYETEDPSVSVKPETKDDLDKVETENTDISDTEDLMAPAMPATMHTSDVELTVSANEDVEVELKDTNINEGIHIDGMSPSHTLDVELTTAVACEDAEEELKDTNINEGILINDIPPYDTLDVESTVAASEDAEEELKYTNINEGILIDGSDMLDVELMVAAIEEAAEEVKDMNINEGTLTDEMSPSDTLDVELTVAASEDVEEEMKDMNINGGTLIDEMPPSDALDIESIVAASEDVEEESKDTNINESTLIDDMPPSDTLDVELTVAASEDLEEKLKDTNIGEVTLIDEMPPSDLLAVEPTLAEVRQIQPVHVNVEESMDVSSTESVDVQDEAMEDELQQVITENKEGKGISYVMPVSYIEEAEPVLEEEVNEPLLTPLEVKPTMKLSDIELQETKGQNLDEISLKASDESEDPSVSVKLESMQVSQFEVMDVAQPYAENELHVVETEDTSEGDTEDLPPPATMHISDVELTDAANEDMNTGEAVLIDGLLPSDALEAEPTLIAVNQPESSHVMLEATMEVSTTKSMDVEDRAVENELLQVSTDNRAENDTANMMPVEPTLEEEVGQPHSTPVELKPQVSDIEVQNAIGQNTDDAISLAINEEAGESYIKDAEQSSHQLEFQLVQDEGVNRSMLEQPAENDSLGSSVLLKQDPLLEAERNEDKISSNGLAEASADTALLLAAEAEIKREEIYLTGDFLSSGAALLEHPSKALTGGDDAYFVAGGKWLGVANGVSQWSFEGTDPGVYAQELMRTCEEIVLDNRSVPISNPVELLCRGVKETNMSGSSNVLIANFDGQALHVANIGDAGFLIIRHGAIYKKSSPLLHEFHFALQVEDCDDPLQLVEEYTIELEEGDLVVSATDGLFDNLYEREIAMIVSKSLQAWMKPEEIANVLATRAQEVGRSAFVRSPFSDAAQAAGYTGYAGGKPDNVAVIVSLVEKRSNLHTE